MNFIKRFFENRKAKKLADLRRQVARDLWFFHENDNRGLLFRKLAHMLGVSRATMDVGWTCYVDVTMSDGYTIFASDIWASDALKKAAMRVVRRLQETRLSF
jgi:hypothetical protein